MSNRIKNKVSNTPCLAAWNGLLDMIGVETLGSDKVVSTLFFC